MPKVVRLSDGDKIGAMTETTTTDISPEGIVGNIAQAIVVHQLSPGTKPREEALAWVCNVSRTKVRVALSMLTKDELIRMELDRGVFVVKPDKTEAREVFIVRCMPEVALIRELITKTTSADCKRLEKYLAEEYKVAANDDLSDAPCRNRLMVDSHLPMADAVDNSMLREMPYGFSARSSAITMIC